MVGETKRETLPTPTKVSAPIEPAPHRTPRSRRDPS